MRVQRQAVVVVHGIGEQVPLETLRGFVLGDGPNATEDRTGVLMGQARVFSDPSPAAVTCKDRIYTARWIHDVDVLADEEKSRRTGADVVGRGLLSQSAIMTDFYEFYWAPRFRDTTIGDVLSWALALVRRPRDQYRTDAVVGRESPGYRLTLRLLLVVAVFAPVLSLFTDLGPLPAGLATAFFLVSAVLLGTHLGLLTTFRTLIVSIALAFATALLLFGVSRSAAVVTFVTGGVLSAVLAEAGRRVASTLGDAARYLSNGPSSVEESEQLQSGVLTLLEQLHDMREEDGTHRYERVVVVGHSLGAVIAYDAVTLLWQRRNRHLALPPAGNNTHAGRAAQATETHGEELRSRTAAGGLVERDGVAACRCRYREAQAALGAALRNPSSREDRTAEPAGVAAADVTPSRWIVTDLVTLGAPLTYADAFLADGNERLLERFEDRSLHQCPPVPQRSPGARAHPYRIGLPKDGTYPRTVLHSGAAFAAVRWTNRWFRHDIVGGPVAPHFGEGVDDQPLSGDKSWIGWFLMKYPHSSYWRKGKHSCNHAGTEECRQLLHDLLHRPPVYVLTCNPDAVDDDLLASLVAHLNPPPEERSGIEVEVRLQAGERLGHRVPVYLPVSMTTFPTAQWDTAIEALLDQTTELVFGQDPLGEIGAEDLHDAELRDPGCRHDTPAVQPHSPD